MDTSLQLHNGLLFRPWDCQNRFKTVNLPTTATPSKEAKLFAESVHKVQQPTGKCPPRLAKSMPSSPVPVFGPCLPTSLTARSSLYSLMNSSSHCNPHPPSNNKPCQPKPVEYPLGNLKPMQTNPFPMSAELSHGLALANAATSNLYGMPSMYAYHFPHNLSSSVFGGAAPFSLDSLMSSKSFLSAASASSALAVSSLEKAIEQQNLLDRPNKKQRPKRFQCPHCQVSFSNNGQLKGHIRIHTGERPFVCDQANCGKTFTRNEELTRHKRIHTGHRPFACSICNKRFGRKDHLKKHVKTHQRPAPIPIPLPLDPALSYAALAYSWL